MQFTRSESPRGLDLAGMTLSALAVVLFLVMPLIALLLRALPEFGAGVASPMVVDALRLSLLTTSTATLITVIIGTPTAYLLARHRFFGQTVLSTLIDLPIVLPPAVAGLALLMAFGRRGLLGQALTPFNISIPFTTVAVIMAQTFIAAPFYIRNARVGFCEVDYRLEKIGATLGASTWVIYWRITIPLASRSLLSGAMMTWARALGEFGATIMFAGNFQGRTQTMPLAIYMGLQQNLSAALTLAAILLVVSFSLLILIRFIAGKEQVHA